MEPASKVARTSRINEYPVLSHRRQRDEEELVHKEGDVQITQANMCQRLNAQIAQLPEQQQQMLLSDRSEGSIRFVHISDTHKNHDQVILPKGDVLIHTGDILQMSYERKPGDWQHYDNAELNEQLDDFKQFLVSKKKEYDVIIFNAGNHDVLMDKDHARGSSFDSQWQKFLKNLPENVIYLENSGCEYKGLKIWASPHCKKWFRDRQSCAFMLENDAEREKIFSTIPNDLDVLMTHGPPKFETGGLSQWGDPVLGDRLLALEQPPAVHCFGHTSPLDYGVQCLNGMPTLFVHGGLHHMIGKGACAWVFDVAIRNAKL